MKYHFIAPDPEPEPESWGDRYHYPILFVAAVLAIPAFLALVWLLARVAR
jgi:hypothetical protein